MRVFFYRRYDGFTEVPSQRDQDTTPEGGTEKRYRPKVRQGHTKYPSWDRDEVTNHGDESPDEGIKVLIFEKERFRAIIFFLRDEDIFPILEEEWLPDELTEDEVVRCRSYDRANTPDECREKWIKSPTSRNPSSRNHDEL